jgi:hypothetical protein
MRKSETMKQMTLAATGFEKHNRATRKAEFLVRIPKQTGWNTPKRQKTTQIKPL